MRGRWHKRVEANFDCVHEIALSTIRTMDGRLQLWVLGLTDVLFEEFITVRVYVFINALFLCHEIIQMYFSAVDIFQLR